MIKRPMILLNPGPANTTESVKNAMVHADLCPRETHFGDVMGEVADGLAELLYEEGDDELVAVLFGGSGTAGVEAAIASVVPNDGKLLVLDNGAYGARIRQIAEAYAMPHEAMVFGIGEPLDLARIQTRLAQGDITQVAVIHHETTTGMLNPVAEVGVLCRQHGAEMIVDAMSSYAAVPMTMRSLSADFLISSSNKCVQGMAGLSFVVGKKSRIESMQPITGRSLYLNVGIQYSFFKTKNQMRFTPPVQVVYALHQALVELKEEGGVAKRRARYDACFAVLDGGMMELGFERLLPEAQLSRILTAYIEPTHPAYSYDGLHDALYERGFTIYPGKGAKRGTFRLANMGAISPEDMSRFIEAMKASLAALGINKLY